MLSEGVREGGIERVARGAERIGDCAGEASERGGVTLVELPERRVPLRGESLLLLLESLLRALAGVIQRFDRNAVLIALRGESVANVGCGHRRCRVHGKGVAAARLAGRRLRLCDLVGAR